MDARRLMRAAVAIVWLAGAGAVLAPGLVTTASAAPAQMFMRPCIAVTKCLSLDTEQDAGDDLRGSDGSNGFGGDGGGTSNPDDSGGGDGGGGGGGGGDVVPRPPTPAELQWQVVNRAETGFLQPDVTIDAGEDPDVKVTSTVNIPTFIEVTNWQGVEVDTYWDDTLTWYITVTATPRLSFDPGEPGAPIVRCEPGGTRYDPNGPSAEEQASRPGACAYDYKMRTGVDGRPDEWTGRVIVDWTVVWEANFDLSPYDPPTAAQLVEEVPREVQEISSVVVD